MQEQISQSNHDLLGCDGWELSAHAASAPDHEPHQGKQYTDEEYQRLNNSLVRRIGTLNCGHAAFPIIIGVNSPQYTKEELEELRRKNEEGVTVDGRHYTGYQATQRQRKFERTIRKQKRRILVDEATGDKEKLQTDQIRLVRLRQEYGRFSKAAGLPQQYARMETAGFDWKKGKAAENVAKAAEKQKMLLKAIEDNGIIHKGTGVSTAPTPTGYTAEQYQGMLTNRKKVSISKDISSLGIDGDPDTIVDLVRPDGQVKQRRVYGPAGKAVIDYDTDDHGMPKQHPTGAHKHLFNYKNKRPRGNPTVLTDGDLELNSDIIREGDNYNTPKTEKTN